MLHKLRTYIFYNAFPTALSPITLDWSTGEIEEFTCTWTYDYWLPEGGFLEEGGDE